MTNSATTDPFTDKTLPRRRARFALCPSPADYRVQVQIQQLNSDSRPKQGRTRAESARFCEEHALEQWARHLEVLP